MSSSKPIYYVHLFVVSRIETIGIAAKSSSSAARQAKNWYRRHRDDLDSGEFILGDEISHCLVRADGQAEEEAELLESSENPLISILIDLVACHDRAPHAKPLAAIVEDARERLRCVV